MITQPVSSLLHALVPIALIVLVFTVVPARANSGRVVGVIDGDTVDVLFDKTPTRIRLSDIDAPERRQAFGNRARQKLSELIFKHTVEVKESAIDRYGRVVARIYRDDGVDINAEMVRLGFAWVYRQYSKDASILTLEEDPRADRRGLWADSDPTPPWVFRRAQRNNGVTK